MNRDWIEERMAELGITYHAMKREFRFSPDTLKGWEEGSPPRAYSLRKLARILQISFAELVRGLGVTPGLGMPRTKGRK